VEAQYLRARWYDVATGRFTSRDPWEGDYERPQSLNGWVYVEGNPIRYIDPTGYRPLVPPGIPTPPIVSRSEWGAMKPGKHYVLEGRFQTGRAEGFYDPVDNVAGYASYSDLYPDDSLADILYAIVIHHEGNSQTYDIWQVQWKHMVENGWNDIGYHFAVDPSGIIYEGRDINPLSAVKYRRDSIFGRRVRGVLGFYGEQV
ncbi:MAG: hypothetical protein GVY30_09490, partial [Chloroflexi bacterium]|nr:hypothetical protein [Chloroflexota bacterium]